MKYALVAWVMTGCVAHPMDGIFVCETEDDCPNGWVCHDEHCYQNAQDAGRDRDGGRDVDAGMTDGGRGQDAGMIDAGRGQDSGMSDGGRAPDAGMTDAGRGDDAGMIDGGRGEDAGVDAGASFDVVGSIGSTGPSAGGTFAVVDNGFEAQEPACTSDRSLCVVGGIVP